MNKSPEPYLQHIIAAAKQIAEYMNAIEGESQFRTAPMVRDAVIRQLEIIGEACGHLEDDFKSAYPNIPWREITGMRNKLAHEYWDIDLELVWTTATEEVPVLEQQVRMLLPVTQ